MKKLTNVFFISFVVAMIFFILYTGVSLWAHSVLIVEHDERLKHIEEKIELLSKK